MKPRVKINNEQCEQIGKILKNLRFRPEFYRREFITCEVSPETKMRMFLYAAAICHQTHSLINKQKKLKGWDYIESVFTDLGKQGAEFLDPRFLGQLSESELRAKLKRLFSPDGRPQNCTLDRLEERARFLLDLARTLNRKYRGRVGNLIAQGKGQLVNRGGLYQRLAEFLAFSDPMRKKSTFFLKLLVDAGLLKIKDPENFVPIMDYHMQRVLLRMGCVEIIDPKLKKKLLNRGKVSSDEAVRNACVEATQIIAKISGHPIVGMNDFFWSLGRSCCKEKTLCSDGVCAKEPCTFALIVDLDSHQECLFAGVCKGSKDSEYRKFWQPIVETHYY